MPRSTTPRNCLLRRFVPILLCAALGSIAGCRQSSAPVQDLASAGNTPSGQPTRFVVTPPAVAPVQAVRAQAADPACQQENISPLPVQPPGSGVPQLTRRVTDTTGVLSSACIASLTQRLQSLEDATGAQVAVLLVPGLNGDDVEAYANRVFHQWRLGRKRVDDGVLIVAALADRRARIEVGYGLEQVIPDAVAGDILRQDLQQNFAARRYNTGISAIVADVAQHLTNGAGAPPSPVSKGEALSISGRPSPQNTAVVWCFGGLLLLSVLLGVIAEGIRLGWPLRLLAIPAVADAVVLAAIAGGLFHGYRMLVAMVPISLCASLLGIPFVRTTRAAVQWLGSCIAVTMVILCIAIALSRPNRLEQGWTFASCVAGILIGTLLFGLSKLMRGSHLSTSSARSTSDSWSGSSSSSSSSDSGSSSSGGFSGGGGDSGGGGASTSW